MASRLHTKSFQVAMPFSSVRPPRTWQFEPGFGFQVQLDSNFDLAGVRDHALQQMEAAWPGRGALREGVGEDHIYVTQTGAVGPDCVVFQDLPESSRAS